MQELLASGLRVRLPVRGSSMTPTLRTGDRIIVAASNGFDLRPGELAVYRRGGRLYAHRFFRLLVDGEAQPVLQFVADAKAEPDPLVKAEAVVGRIVGIERHLVNPLLAHVRRGVRRGLALLSFLQTL